MRPGKTSPVFSTTASSELSASMGPVPARAMSPRLASFSATAASCPVASTTTRASRETGSTQVICLGSAPTGVQFTTTPQTWPPLTTTSSTVTIFKILTPASQAEAMSLEHAQDAQGAVRFSLSRFTTVAEIDRTVKALEEVIERLSATMVAYP